VTRVDFYIVTTDSDDARLKLACRIAEKAMQNDKSVFIHTEQSHEAERLDEALWTFSAGSFVPHCIVRGGDTTDTRVPVIIGAGAGPGGEPCDIMINLGEDVPEFFSRYDRVVEVVDANERRRRAGRKRFRYYRDRGYEMATHNID
jgi:DNA polymerase-3 subunit chi